MKAIATVGERLQLIKDWQLSGLTISEWCRRNGIHKNTFSNWIHRFRKQGLLETPAVNDSELDKRCVLCYTENATNPMIARFLRR